MHIRIRAPFLLYGLSVAFLASGWACLGAVSALLIHEGAHLAAIRLTGEKIETLEVTPFGGVMTYAPGKSANKGLRGLLVAAAGPFGNYLMLLLVSQDGVRALLPLDAARQILLANAVMMLINLLPALPLDGGRMLFSVGYYFFSVSRLIGVLTAMGMAAGGFLIAAGLYGAAVMGILNVSALIVGAYLMTCAFRSRSVLLAENLYAVIQERREKPLRMARMALYAVPANTRLISLLDPIERSREALFYVRDEEGGAARFVTDSEVLEALLSTPHAVMADVAGSSEAKCDKNKVLLR